MTEAARAVADLAARIRSAGITVGTAQVIDAALAVTLFEAGEVGAAPAALVAIFASSRDEAEVVRPIVERWLAGRPAPADLELGIAVPAGPSPGRPEEATGEPDDAAADDATGEVGVEPGDRAAAAPGAGEASGPRGGERATGDDDDGEPPLDDEEPPRPSPWSAVEILHRRRFDAYTEDDLARAAAYLAALPPLLPQRQLRRLRAAPRGSTLDLRRTLSASVRMQGEPLVRSYRARTTGPRRVVILIDVSGSMERWTRPLLLFLHAVVRTSRHVEGFAFGTRLTRLTRALDVRDASAALARAADAVPDWSGGTLIGENLGAFNRLYGRRGATREAAVVIISDGWERGDTDRLRRELEELRRTAHSIVWANPLAGADGYQPLVAGLVAALDYVDVFLPSHDLAAIDSLVDIVRALPERRPAGRATGARPDARVRPGARSPQSLA